jgi:large exoprotein involved in heme utilization and adhesion
LESGGQIQADNYGSNTGPDITLNISDSILVSGLSSGNQASGVFAGNFGSGNAGTATVNASSIDIRSGGEIQAIVAASATGKGAEVNINSDSLVVQGNGKITANTWGSGDANNINITTDNMQVTGEAQIASTSRGDGDSGNITITVDNSLAVSGDNSAILSGIFSNAFSDGDGGNVTITASSLSLSDSSAIQTAVSADAENPGLPAALSTTQAGSITVNTSTLNITGGAQVSAQSTNAGQAGSITISSDAISINSSPGDATTSGIYSTSTDSGHGGNIAIAASDITMTGGAINVSSAGTGDAGDITATTATLKMSNGAQFSTSTSGSGNGGELTVIATDKVAISGRDASQFSSGLYSTVSGSGTGGNISLSGHDILISDSGTLSAKSTGTGNAGNITATATESFKMYNSSITTEALLSDGGNITVNANTLVYLSNSSITAAVGSGLGNGGNIDIDPIFVILDSSQILANAFGGDGGNITIVAENYIASPDSVLNASSELKQDGTITIESPDVDMDSGITQLPDNYLDASKLVRQRCGAQNMANRSSFLVSGRSAIPASPASMAPLTSSLTIGMSTTLPTSGYDLPDYDDYYASVRRSHLRPVMATECVTTI